MILDALVSPRGRKRKHGLHGNVKALDTKRLEHDLGEVLSVLGRVHRWFRLSFRNVGPRGVVSKSLYPSSLRSLVTHHQEMMIFRLDPQVFKHTTLMKLLHQVPIINLALSNRRQNRVGFAHLSRFVANVEIHVFDTALAGDCEALGARFFVDGDFGGDDEGRVVVSRKAW